MSSRKATTKSAPKPRRASPSLSHTLSTQFVGQYISQVARIVTTVSPDLGPDREGFIHQYTSLRAFDDALRTGFREIWASSATFMNDSREFEEGRDIFADAVKAVHASTKSKWKKTFLAKVERSLEDLDGHEVFCACFTSEGDHLGQWRGYGDRGNGCCMSFDFAKLESSINGIGSWVVYDEKKQSQIANEILQAFMEEVERLWKPFTIPLQAKAAEFASRTFLDLLPALCLLFKHSSFAEEREYRVIYSDPVRKRACPSDVRLAASTFVPFVKLDFDHQASAPLARVRLGPGMGVKKHLVSVEKLLRCRGFDSADVRLSEIPYLPM